MQDKASLEEKYDDQSFDRDGTQENITEYRESILCNLKNRVTSFFKYKQKTTLKESVEEILVDHEESVSSNPQEAGERAMIRNVLEFNELFVENIMIPRADIFAISDDMDLDNLKHDLLEKTYTRIPVYKENLDDIKGFIHIKDIARTLLEDEKDLKISSIIRKALFVPASMKINNLLIKMQQSKVHIAIVIDEYGGTEGIVTMEDIMEEIVGKIEDEHDEEIEEKREMIVVSENVYEMSSREEMKLITEKTGFQSDIENAEFDTIGSFVYKKLGRIPDKNEIIEGDDYQIHILEATPRAIGKIKLVIK